MKELFIVRILYKQLNDKAEIPYWEEREDVVGYFNNQKMACDVARSNGVALRAQLHKQIKVNVKDMRVHVKKVYMNTYNYEAGGVMRKEV